MCAAWAVVASRRAAQDTKHGAAVSMLQHLCGCLAVESKSLHQLVYAGPGG